MSLDQKVIDGLYRIVNDLAQQANGHNIQSRIFAAQGFNKLSEKYKNHSIEETGYVDKCIDRLLSLGFKLKNEAKEETPVYDDVVEYLKYDLKISKDGLPWLHEIMEASSSDPGTFDMLKAYYIDEEEDMYWAEQQLDLIEKLGLQNWLTCQL